MIEKTDKEDEKINLNLAKIEPGLDDFIKRRIRHISFAKLLYWLWTQSKKNDFVYVTDLSRFSKLTSTRSYGILNELCSVNLLEKRYTGNIAEYWFVKNSDHTIIERYIEEAKKSLGLV